MIHSRAESLRQQVRSPYRKLLLLWFAMWLAAGLATARWRNAQLYSTAWAWPAALLFIGIGLAFYRQSGSGFGLSELAGLPEIRPGNHDQRLVTTGIRSRVRHPIYAGHLCEMLGWSVGTGLLVCWGLTAFAVITGAIMIRMEEAELEERFGELYVAYRTQVPALLPRL